MAEQTFTIDGKTFTLEQLMELQRQAAEVAKVVKKAEKEGFIEKAKKAPKEKGEDTPEVLMLKDALKAVFETHKATIEALFKATVTEEKPLGNIGVNLTWGENFGCQVLNEATRKAKTPKKEKPAEVAPEVAPAETK